MSDYQLDPSEGPHAASHLSDEELEYLHRITSLEMAIRMNRQAYEQHFREMAEARAELSEMVEQLRADRERMRFVAAVRADLESLPLTTGGANTNQTHGLYL